MHEASLAKNIIDIVAEYSAKIQGKRVTKIFLRVGELSGVYPEALSQYFEELSQGTVTEAAILEFEKVLVRGKCRGCTTEFELKNFELCCPQCNSDKFDVLGGDEFELTRLEIE